MNENGNVQYIIFSALLTHLQTTAQYKQTWEWNFTTLMTGGAVSTPGICPWGRWQKLPPWPSAHPWLSPQSQWCWRGGHRLAPAWWPQFQPSDSTRGTRLQRKATQKACVRHTKTIINNKQYYRIQHCTVPYLITCVWCSEPVWYLFKPNSTACWNQT